MSEYYGWISKVSNKTVQQRGGGTGTSKYFRYYFENKGFKRATHFRSKNLYYNKDEFIYILSIKGKTWYPYPFITQIPKLTLVLTQDTGDKSGKVWFIKKDENDKIIEKNEQLPEKYNFNKMELKWAPASKCYSLPYSQLEKRSKTPKAYEFCLDAGPNSVENIVKEIITDIMNDNAGGNA